MSHVLKYLAFRSFVQSLTTTKLKHTSACLVIKILYLMGTSDIWKKIKSFSSFSGSLRWGQVMGTIYLVLKLYIWDEKKIFLSMNISKTYLKFIDILFMWLKKLFLRLIFSSWEISTLVLLVKRVKHIHAQGVPSSLSLYLHKAVLSLWGSHFKRSSS